MTQKPNLIGVAGRIGSGKDTVGAIIQYLLHVDKYEKTGRVPYNKLNDFLQGSVPYTAWQVKKFAGKLKEVASLLTGIPADQFENQKFKDSYMSSAWSYSKQITEFDGDEGEDAYAFLPMTYRLFLQKLGTEAIRNGLHPNTWVNALFAGYFEVASTWDSDGITTVSSYPNWIITDLRFPNEFEAIKDRGGVCIRVERYPKEIIHNQDTGKQFLEKFDITNEEHRKLYEGENFRKGLHPSEIALDSHSFDYVLNNSGSIEDLVEEIKKMLVHFKLIES